MRIQQNKGAIINGQWILENIPRCLMNHFMFATHYSNEIIFYFPPKLCCHLLVKLHLLFAKQTSPQIPPNILSKK